MNDRLSTTDSSLLDHFYEFPMCYFIIYLTPTQQSSPFHIRYFDISKVVFVDKLYCKGKYVQDDMNMHILLIYQGTFFALCRPYIYNNSIYWNISQP